MPHVNIKHFPRDLTDAQKSRLADSVTAVIAEHFDAHEDTVSIVLEPVAESDWNRSVVAVEIEGREHLVIKPPNYPEQ